MVHTSASTCDLQSPPEVSIHIMGGRAHSIGNRGTDVPSHKDTEA